MDRHTGAELTALALEYQRDYGTARGNLDISDFVNNPFLNSPSSIFGLGLQEQSSDLISGKFGVLSNNPAAIIQDVTWNLHATERNLAMEMGYSLCRFRWQSLPQGDGYLLFLLLRH